MKRRLMASILPIARAMVLGVLWAADPKIIVIDVPGATNTYVTQSNVFGAMTGYYTDASSPSHGFLRATNGSFVSIDAGDAGFTIASTPGHTGCFGIAAKEPPRSCQTTFSPNRSPATRSALFTGRKT